MQKLYRALQQASQVLACLLLINPMATSQAEEFRLLPLAVGEVSLPALERAPSVQPLRYRVVVIPGSGCSGMGTFAGRYFAGLLHAQVLVLQKPGIAPYERTAAANCPPDFVRNDNPASWQRQARLALQGWLQNLPDERPLWLVGISEGAELLPGLAADLPGLAGLVLIASSGLDPWEAGTLQAERQGQQAAWQALERMLETAADDDEVRQGRSLRYWRQLRHWPLAAALLQGPWPVLQAWGRADEKIPLAAYTRFQARAEQRPAAYRSLVFEDADHGLQNATVDGIQRLWVQLEQWARDCLAIRATPSRAPPGTGNNWTDCWQAAGSIGE